MKGNMKITKIAVTSLMIMFLSLSLFSGAALPAELKTFRLGGLWPMTGPFSYYGRVMSHGALTAVDQINDAGGVKGYKLDLVITDFRKANVELAISGARKMTAIDKVPFLLTSFSAISLGVQPIAADEHVLMINGGGASPKLMKKPYLYNVRMLYGPMFPPGLKYMWDQGYRKLALVTHSDPSGTDPRDEYVIPLWKKWGGKIVASEMNEVGNVDFSAQMSRVKAAKPDLIVSLQTGETVGYAIKGAKDMGLTQPILTNEFPPVVIDIIGKERCSNIFVPADTFDRTNSDPSTQKFVKDYEAKWKEDAEHFAANYYDGVYILAELIRRVVDKGGNPFDGAQLEAAIWDNPKFDTAYGGKMTLRKDGTVLKTFSLYELKMGKMNLIKSFPPSE